MEEQRDSASTPEKRSKPTDWLLIVLISIAMVAGLMVFGSYVSTRPARQVDSVAIPDSIEVDNTAGAMEASGNDIIGASNLSDAMGNATAVSGTAPNIDWCDATAYIDTPENCARVTEYIKHLKIADSAWSSPDTMYVGDTKEVRFAITGDSKSMPVATVLGAKPTETAPVKAGGRMAASLEGVGFDVSPTDTVEKSMLGGAAAWSWKVKALDGAQHNLALSVYVDIPDDTGQPTHNLVRLLHRDMKVRITWTGWFEGLMSTATDWVKSLTAFAIALKALIAAVIAILVVLGVRRSRGKQKDPSDLPHDDDNT